jgi:hypothetical protein
LPRMPPCGALLQLFATQRLSAHRHVSLCARSSGVATQSWWPWYPGVPVAVSPFHL